MTDSLYLPDAKVEIAWNVGYDDTVEPVWTDVSAWVKAEEGIDPNRGRNTEFDTADANTVSLTLDNSDGRFTAGREASPYWPNVKMGRRLRVTATPPGGTPSVRFTGYVNQWPTRWAGAASDASTQVSASSRLARLGHAAELTSVIEETYRVDGPVAYWPLGEAEESTAGSNVTGYSQPDLTFAGSGPPVTFGTGTGPGTDDLPAPLFAGGQWLSAIGVTITTDGNAPSRGTLECFVRPVSAGLVAYAGSLRISVRSDGRFEAVDQTHRVATVLTSPTSVIGETHHVALTRAYSSGRSFIRLYVDGALVAAADQDAFVPFWGPDKTTSVKVGGAVSDAVPSILAGTIAHVAVYDVAITASRIAAHAQSGLGGWADELPGTRIVRYAGFGRVPAAQVDADMGSTTIAHIDTTGASIVDLLRRVEETDGGVLYDSADNLITYRDRASRYRAAVGLTLDMAAHEVEADFEPVLDDSALVNVAEATNHDGTVHARITDETSRREYGTYTTTLELATNEAGAPAARAGWLVNVYGEPRPRVPSLSVELSALDPAQQAAVLAADVGTLVEVVNIPAQAAHVVDRWFIEGISEAITDASYALSFNVSPAEPWLDVFVLDDPARGVLDSTFHLAG